MTEDTPAKRSRRLPQFSMRTLLLFMAVCAAGTAVWQVFIYKSPTYRLPIYERAPGTRRAIQLGPNKVELKLVARNDRDGTLQIENGRGQALTAAQPLNQLLLTSCTSWLDVVQVELSPGPELLDVIQMRIMNHETREPIALESSAYGWRLAEPRVIHLYGLGKELPSTVDVWLRVHSYDANDPVSSLAPKAGASCSLAGGTLTLKDIRAGSWSWQWDRGFLTKQEGEHQTSTIIEWNGEWPEETKYQIAAVAKSGKRSFPDLPHFLDPVHYLQPITFDLPLAEIDRFELRPFGGRHAFFFDGVQLPKASGKPFGPPPTAVVDIGGREIEATLPEFAPLEVWLATRRGKWASGITG